MDLRIIETGNGGDVVKKRRDLAVIEGLENFAYLALFGGNVKASTPRQRLESEQAFDWWGNSMIPNEPSLQMNSETERVLNSVPLNSAGRQLIINAIKTDLAFMRDFAEVGVAVSIPSDNTVVIGISMKEPDNLQAREFIYIWDATKIEVISPYNPGTPGPVHVGFQYDLNFEFI